MSVKTNNKQNVKILIYNLKLVRRSYAAKLKRINVSLKKFIIPSVLTDKISLDPNTTIKITPVTAT